MADPFTKWPPDEIDLGWLAGLLEGEGSFMQLKESPGVPVLSIGMIDEDVIAKAAMLMGVSYHPHALPSGKTRYQLMIRGNRRARRIMETLLPFMSARRKTQIEMALRTNE